MPSRIAQAVAAFGIASLTSACAAYGRAMNYDLVPVDSGADTAITDTGAWPIDTATPEPVDTGSDATDAASDADADADAADTDVTDVSDAD